MPISFLVGLLLGGGEGPANHAADVHFSRHGVLLDRAVIGNQRLLALHNLTFLLKLMEQIRGAIRDERFDSWSTAWLERYRAKGA